MTQSSQEPGGLPQNSSAIPDPVDEHSRDLNAVVAGGVRQPEVPAPTAFREWYHWPFSKEVWMIVVTAVSLAGAALLFGGPGFAVVFWVAVIFWVILYGFIWKILLNG